VQGFAEIDQALDINSRRLEVFCAKWYLNANSILTKLD
jgi:hypothetical protein